MISLGIKSPTAILINREIGLDQLAIMFKKIANPIVIGWRFLATGEREFQRARRAVALFLIADKIIGKIAAIALSSEAPRA